MQLLLASQLLAGTTRQPGSSRAPACRRFGTRPRPPWVQLQAASRRSRARRWRRRWRRGLQPRRRAGPAATAAPSVPLGGRRAWLCPRPRRTTTRLRMRLTVEASPARRGCQCWRGRRRRSGLALARLQAPGRCQTSAPAQLAAEAAHQAEALPLRILGLGRLRRSRCVHPYRSRRSRRWQRGPRCQSRRSSSRPSTGSTGGGLRPRQLGPHSQQ